MIATLDQIKAAPLDACEEAEVVLRPIRPEDKPLLVAMHSRNSERTLRMRFFGLPPGCARDDVRRLCRLTDDCGFALAAVHRDGQAQAQVAGVAQYSLQDVGEAEFALVVSDDWQHHGLGRRLMQRLIAAARERGVRRLKGQVLIENKPMLRLMKQLGFAMRLTTDPTVVEAEMSLVARQFL
jgi:acetyltransferase